MFSGTYGSKILQHQLLNSKTSVNLRKEPGTGNIDCFDLLQISYAPKHVFISQMHLSKGESQSQWPALPCSTHTALLWRPLLDCKALTLPADSLQDLSYPGASSFPSHSLCYFFFFPLVCFLQLLRCQKFTTLFIRRINNSKRGPFKCSQISKWNAQHIHFTQNIFLQHISIFWKAAV